MPREVQHVLNSTGGLQAVAIDGEGQIARIFPRDVKGRDVLVAYPVFTPGVHQLHLAIFDLSGRPVAGKSVMVYALR